MDAAFWHSRWQEGRTGFHQDRPTPLLVDHWPALGVAKDARVLVPLCGKSLDMAWLASRGLQVRGVELSPLAVQQFFEMQGVEPTVDETPSGPCFRAGAIEILCGDVFACDPAFLRDCDAVYDRAALIALPHGMRRRYADEVYARLPTGCRGLLVTLEYPQHEKQGPPISVDKDEVGTLFEPEWHVHRLAVQDILDGQPAFRADGVTALTTAAYRLERH